MTDTIVTTHFDPNDDPDDVSTNPSTQTPFSELVAHQLSRRNVLIGGLATAAATFLAPAAGALAAPGGRPGAPAEPGAGRREGLLGFTAITPSEDDRIRLPEGYTADVLIPWGTAIRPGGPAWSLTNTADEQREQVGSGHDGMHFFPLGAGPKGSRRGLLVLNHEYTNADVTASTPGDAAARARKDMAAHGVSVVEIADVAGTWEVVESPLARRVTAETPMTLTGPAAGHRLVTTASDPAGRTVYGTVNNCAHGVTPWGTYLTCEENFQGYFRAADTADDPSLPVEEREQRRLDRRLGVTSNNGRGWQAADPRFDLRTEGQRQEVNRFGWVVEIDPFDPDATPAKRTALGRFKHEGATITEGRGKRVVVYLGDDQAGDYLYKFVGDGNWTSQRARGRSPLDHGTLYVARFDEDGRGSWLPLTHGTGPLTAANGFADQGEVLVKTRLAADALGATPMDRAEWTAVDPRSGDVYFTLTNNSSTTAPANAANPRRPNPDGHIIRIAEARADNASTDRFAWDIYLLAGTGEGTGDGSTIPADQAFGSPDGLWFDPSGRLWIQTDGRQPIASNDQMLASDPETNELRRFLTGPKDCEVTGVVTTPDQRTMFVNIQHPGNGDPAVSNWPEGGDSHPRAATVVIRREEGGVIGA